MAGLKRRPGEPARTREVKIGCVFTQTSHDEAGFAIRDPDSTTYTGAIETAEEFGKRLYLEAWNRGWTRAANKVVLGDGAEWIRNLAAQHFPGAIQIVDLYHARQHLWTVARLLHPGDANRQQAWMKVHQEPLLDQGKIEELVVALRLLASGNPALAETIRTEADYLGIPVDENKHSVGMGMGIPGGWELGFRWHENWHSVAM